VLCDFLLQILAEEKTHFVLLSELLEDKGAAG
jgi:hypothetical protein